ncbi:MAG: LysR family transcriptional regulator [Selenomonadales bacterium]|nr:LysR family transcriptional regulator [Selenomonadales bacterium]
MDIKHIKYFVDVARLKSFSKAAQANFVSQSTISKGIRDMENEIGEPLFHRSSKHVELTDMGERLVLVAAKLVGMFTHMTEYLRDEKSVEKGLLRIGLPPITGATVFGQLLGRFKRRYAGIDIQLFEYGSKNVESALKEGSIDVGIVCSKPQEGMYHTILFPKDTLKVVLHPTHPLAELHQIDIRDLEKENFVLYRKDFSLHDAIVKRCKAAGFVPNVILETTQRELMTQIVEANLGITLLPAQIADGLSPRHTKAIPLADPQIYLEIALIWNEAEYVPRAVQLWTEFVREYVEQQSYL